MAEELTLQQIAWVFKAGADLSGWQHRFVRISGVFAVKTATARGEIHGVLLNKPDAQNKAAHVLLCGVGKLVSDGSTTAGAWLVSDASGRCDVATMGTGTNADLGGYALEVDGGAGSKIAAMICRHPGEL